MSAANPFFKRALRFCEVCGLFVGNMNVKEWDQASHLCKDCDEAYGNPRMILMNNAFQTLEDSSHDQVKLTAPFRSPLLRPSLTFPLDA